MYQLRSVYGFQDVCWSAERCPGAFDFKKGCRIHSWAYSGQNAFPNFWVVYVVVTNIFRLDIKKFCMDDVDVFGYQRPIWLVVSCEAKRKSFYSQWLFFILALFWACNICRFLNWATIYSSLRWPIYVFNSVVSSKLPVILSHRRSTTVSLETYPLEKLMWSLR